MIVVRIELVSAVTGKTSEIGRMVITNDGTSDTLRRGNYDVRVGRRGAANDRAVLDSPQRRGRVENYPRLSSNVWRLVARALAAVKFNP